MNVVAKAPPDGYTLGVISSGHVVNPVLYASIPYDTLKDFAGVSPLASLPSALVVSPSLGIRKVRDLVASAKAKPGTAGNAPAAKAPAATAKQSPVESKVAAMGEPPCEAQRSPYKAMLCKLRKEREAAAKAAEEAAAANPGADKPGADKPGADKSAPGNPTGGKGNQPAANNQQPPMSRGLVAGVGFSVGLLLGLLFSLFYYRFYRR